MANLTKEQRKQREQQQAAPPEIDNDQKIINDNPGRDAYELLQMGLSPARYQLMINTLTAPKEKQNTAPTAVQESELAKIAPQRVTVIRAQPQTRELPPSSNTDMAWYFPPEGKVGSPTHMTRKAAERLNRSTPGSRIV